MKINEHPAIQARIKRNEQKKVREDKKVQNDLNVELFNDLTDVLSKAGYTLKNVMFIVEGLIDKGWNKQSLKRMKITGQ